MGLSVVLHSDVWLTGVGCSVADNGGVEVRFGVGRPEGAFEVVVPVVQPVALPFRPAWRLKRTVDFGRGARGAAFLSWSPGSAPAVLLHGWRKAWSIAAGSSGVFLTREFRCFGETPFRVQCGWVRAGIPWTGVTTRQQWSERPVGFSESPLWNRRP